MKENEDVNEVTEEIQGPDEYITLYDGRRTALGLLETSDDPKMILAASEGVKNLTSAIIQTEKADAEYELRVREADQKDAELAQTREIAMRQIYLQERQLKATKIATIVSAVAPIVVGGIKFFESRAHDNAQGENSLSYAKLLCKMEKDENIIINDKRRLIPPIFSK